MPETYLLDTCIFNRLLDGEIRLSDISSDGLFVATHVQFDELSATKQDVRKGQLMDAFKEVGPRLDLTESFCFDVSRFDMAKWSDGKLLGKLKACLDAKETKRNNTQDALIAEVAIVRGFTLVTADGPLAEAAKEHGAKVLLV